MNNDADPRPSEAVDALRARGVNSAEDMLEHATPDQILAACHRWDLQRGNKTTGLLVHWIRAGQFEAPATKPASKATTLHDRFDQYAATFPEGSIAEPHARLQARRWTEDEPCPGAMIVIETLYPIISTRCDECDFEAGYSVASLYVLDEADR